LLGGPLHKNKSKWDADHLSRLSGAATLSLTKDDPMTTQGLTAKQSAFIEEYAIDMNASAAATRAGYSAKTAKEHATRLLTNVHVAAAIAEARAERSIRTNITADRVLQEWPDSHSSTSANC
jgi:hypothetical protein